MKTFAKRKQYVRGALTGLLLLGPASALAQASPGFGGGAAPSAAATASNGVTSGSGGPGTLGTEAPNDSAVAQGYIHSRTRVYGESDRKIEEGLRQVITDNQRGIAQAQQGATASDPEQAKLAREVADARAIAQFNLLKSAQESGFNLGDAAEPGFAATGSMGESADLPSYGPGGSPPPSSSATEAGTETGSATGSSTVAVDAQAEASTVANLAKEARDSHRIQLASSLEEAQKSLDTVASLVSAASLGSSAP